MNTRGHLSSESLDLMLLGALPASEKSKVEAHVSSCPRCRIDWEEKQADEAHFRQHVLPRRMASLTPERKGLGLTWIWKLGVPAAVLATLLLALSYGRLNATSPSSNPANELGFKGGPIVEIFAKRGDRVFAVKDGVHVAPGDRLRFVVEPAGAKFLLISSIDNTRHVAPLYPLPPEKGDVQSVPVADGRQELPGSLELDAAPGPEHVYAWFTPWPISLPEVATALAGGSEPSVRGVKPIQIVLEKTP
jgi:hypothetical protein